MTVETLFERVTSGTAGLLLLYVTTIGSVNLGALAYGLLVLVAVWIGAAVALNRRYSQTLFEALKRHTLEDGAASFTDASSLQVIEQALGSPHPATVLFAVDLLEGEAPEVLPSRLLPLLGNADPVVRTAALERLARL